MGNLLLMSSAFKFHENSFTGEIPTELKSLTALTDAFSLNDNAFCGPFASADQLPPNLLNTFDVDVNVKVSIPNFDLLAGRDHWSGQTDDGPCICLLRVLCTQRLHPPYLATLTRYAHDTHHNCYTRRSDHTHLTRHSDHATPAQANTFVGPTPCPATYALTAFYKSTKVTNWAPTPQPNTRWMIGDPCTNSNGVWYGITCSTGGATAEVLTFDLSGDGATDLVTGCGTAPCGTLPTELGGLTSLTSTFSLYGNKLVGPIPSELGRLVALTSGFLVGTNKLTGTLPTQVSPSHLARDTTHTTSPARHRAHVMCYPLRLP